MQDTSATLTQVTTSDGLDLRLRYWLPAGAKSALAFSHGQSDHSGRYKYVSQRLADAGHAVFMVDLRGHGFSPGKRGHITRFSDYLKDIEALQRFTKQQLPDAPSFLGGHSMGGTIALTTALRNPTEWDGVVVSAPWLQLAFNPPRWKTSLGSLASQLLPKFSTSNGLDPADFSHDAEISLAYHSDEHSHGRITARAFAEVDAAGNLIIERAGNFKLPLLMLQGDADTIVDWRVNRTFFNDVTTQDKTLALYPGLFHEVLNEFEKDQVIDDLIAWLDAHS